MSAKRRRTTAINIGEPSEHDIINFTNKPLNYILSILQIDEILWHKFVYIVLHIHKQPITMFKPNILCPLSIRSTIINVNNKKFTFGCYFSTTCRCNCNFKVHFSKRMI